MTDVVKNLEILTREFVNMADEFDEWPTRAVVDNQWNNYMTHLESIELVSWHSSQWVGNTFVIQYIVKDSDGDRQVINMTPNPQTSQWKEYDRAMRGI